MSHCHVNYVTTRMDVYPAGDIRDRFVQQWHTYRTRQVQKYEPVNTHIHVPAHTHIDALYPNLMKHNKSFACIHFRSPPPSQMITLCLSPCCRSGKLNTDKTNLIINDLSPEDSASYTCSLAVAGQTVTHTLTVEGEVFFLI